MGFLTVKLITTLPGTVLSLESVVRSYAGKSQSGASAATPGPRPADAQHVRSWHSRREHQVDEVLDVHHICQRAPGCCVWLLHLVRAESAGAPTDKHCILIVCLDSISGFLGHIGPSRVSVDLLSTGCVQDARRTRAPSPAEVRIPKEEGQEVPVGLSM